MMTKSIYQALVDLKEANKAGVLCTIVRSQGSTPRGVGSKMLVFPNGSIIGTVGGGEVESRAIQEALGSLKDGNPRILPYSMVDPQRGDPGICGGQLEVFVEPIIPAPTLLLIGGGHVGKAVAHLADWLGFRVVVSDDRPAFCTPEAIPEANAFYPVPLTDLPEQMEITPWTYLVLTTRGSDVDIAGLPVLLETPAAYFGVIGSQRRWEMTRKHLITKGISKELLARVHSPIGLELHAETPNEIAVSIMAEILMLRDGGDGQQMSNP
ncbi:XdhC family protein [Chloroflexota bacterium]